MRVSIQNSVFIFALGVAMHGVTPLKAQWASCSSGPAGSACLSTSSGYVGIGTASPGFNLTVQNSGAQLSVQNDSTHALIMGGWDGTQQHIDSINLGVAMTPLLLNASFTTASSPYAQTYPLQVTDTANKADNGNYVGFMLRTADASNPLTGSLVLFTNPNAGGRYMQIGAYDNGVGWANLAMYGNVGIGTSAPTSLLANTGTPPDDGGRGISSRGLTWVQTSSADTGYTAGFVNPNPGGSLTAHGVFMKIADTSATSNILSLLSGSNVSRFLVRGDGTVGVGTRSPCGSSAPTGCLMSVAGAIQAKEVVVNTGWSDYVFDPAYRLAPLSEVAAYVKENHHLPDIPSAEEVREKGVSVGEMQAKLLAKVEELTLHMIEAEKENRELRERIVRLEGGQR